MFRRVFRAIGALSSDPEREPKLRHQIDQVTSDAVELGILFRPTGTTSSTNVGMSVASEQKFVRRGVVSHNGHVYDLSCMSFPVARAACRYVLTNRILPLSLQINTGTSLIDFPDLIFITGSGLQHRLIQAANNDGSSCNSNKIIGIQQPRSMFMREYIQYVLLNDYDLVSVISNVTTPLSSTVTSMRGADSNAVTIKAEALKEWCTSISLRK